MYQLSLVPMPHLVFGRLRICGGFGLLDEIWAQESFDLGDGCSLVAIEVSDFDVEVTVVVKAVSGNGWSERHSERRQPRQIHQFWACGAEDNQIDIRERTAGSDRKRLRFPQRRIWC